jgi:uncharacterized protein (TIGR03118 family)
MNTPRTFSRDVASVVTALALGLALPSHAASSNRYTVHNLVTDPGSGISAQHQDPNLKNGWGVAFNPTGFAWVADNHTGKSTLYDGSGNVNPLVVTIPSANGSDLGSPTGIVFSGSNTDFIVNAGGKSGPARFIFASEDGVISAWAPTVDPTNAIKVATNPDAVYKGLTLTGNGENFFLYAADFRGRKIDIYDRAFQRVPSAGKFVDRNIPADYGPFNVQNILGNLYVTYAKKQAGSDDEMAGPGLGFVDVFDADGNLLLRLAQHGKLNAPWGVALAPTGFGRFSNQILVGNFGDGTINAYDPRTGASHGQLKDADGKVLKIEGLWGIAFGNGVLNQPTDTLFFAAGPHDEEDGLYGRIDAQVPTGGGGNDGEDDD